MLKSQVTFLSRVLFIELCRVFSGALCLPVILSEQSFLNNFQTAKEALSTATVQAAERGQGMGANAWSALSHLRQGPILVQGQTWRDGNQPSRPFLCQLPKFTTTEVPWQLHIALVCFTPASCLSPRRLQDSGTWLL